MLVQTWLFVISIVDSETCIIIRSSFAFAPNRRWLVTFSEVEGDPSSMRTARTRSRPASPGVSVDREGVRIGQATQEGRGTAVTPRISSQGFDSLPEDDPPVCNQGLISQLTASSSIISIQTN